MRTLFPIQVEPTDIPEIPGLRYVPDYITAAQETELAAAVDALPWDTTWERRRQPYGGKYGRGGADVDRPVPAWGLRLAERIHADGLCDERFDHVLVNEYQPGQGIALHRDYDPFDRTVASLSLLAPCVMDFRRLADGRRESLLLEPRSLLVLSDDARYDWEHGISRRKSDVWKGLRIPRARRLSVTFRRLRARQ